MKGKLTPVVRSREFKDEETPLVPTYRPGVWPLPLSCCIRVTLFPLTFQMHLVNLIPGPLPFIESGLWLRQALEPRHCLFLWR